MPFIKVDPEAADELLDEIDDEQLRQELDTGKPPGGFVYEAGEAQFEVNKLEEAAGMVLRALRNLGATRFRVSYDGGYDEGFAYPEDIWIGDTIRDAREVVGDLSRSALVAQLREAGARQRYNPYKEQSNEAVAEYGLDELATALASLLLGDGYGTGEYELYGSLTADLESGEIVDDPEAKPRSGGL